MRLLMDEAGQERQDAQERILDALTALGPCDEPVRGCPGTSVQALAAALKLSEKTVRRGLQALEAQGRAQVVGHAAKGKAYGAARTR